MTIPLAQVIADLDRLLTDPTTSIASLHAEVAALLTHYQTTLDRDLAGVQVETTERFCDICGHPLWDPAEGPRCWECDVNGALVGF